MVLGVFPAADRPVFGFHAYRIGKFHLYSSLDSQIGRHLSQSFTVNNILSAQKTENNYHLKHFQSSNKMECFSLECNVIGVAAEIEYVGFSIRQTELPG